MTTILLLTLTYLIPFICTILLGRYINKHTDDDKENIGAVLIIGAIPAVNIIVVIGLLISIFNIKHGETVANLYSKLNKWFRHEKD